jgi:hypothetical protein
MKTPREVLLNQHRHVEPKLSRIWHAELAPRLSGNVVWRELIWPCRRIWVGLAGAWVLIIAVHLATAEPVSQVAGKSAPALSREEMQALAEQRRLMAQMIDLPPAEHQKPNPPGPRSERRKERVEA